MDVQPARAVAKTGRTIRKLFMALSSWAVDHGAPRGRRLSSRSMTAQGREAPVDRRRAAS
jgi:hypothetical protein